MIILETRSEFVFLWNVDWVDMLYTIMVGPLMHYNYGRKKQSKRKNMNYEIR